MTESLSRRTADRNALTAGARTLPRANAKLCAPQAGVLTELDGWMDGWQTPTHRTSPHTHPSENCACFFFFTNFHPIKIDYDKNRPRGGGGDFFPSALLGTGESYESNPSCVGNPLISHLRSCRAYHHTQTQRLDTDTGYSRAQNGGLNFFQGACGGAQEINLTGREFEAPVLLRGTGVLTI